MKHFKAITLESRIAKMQGTTKTTDPSLVERCNCLEQICNATREKREHARKQLASIIETERRLTNELAKEQSDHNAVAEKLRDRQMYCENGLKAIIQHREKSYERLVEQSVLRMRLHEMETMYNKQIEKFYDLEQHKCQLRLAIDERLVDLRAQLDLLMIKRKHLCGERDVLRADINERTLKIDALRARFECANDLLGKNEDGSVVSAIQLKIETAQEKELLMDQGSKLNEKVISAERDVKALENTLILLNISNDRYKRKMGQVQDNGLYEINSNLFCFRRQNMHFVFLYLFDFEKNLLFFVNSSKKSLQ